ncbi:MAG: VPLPA-CTERM sorting domain-containing protein [Rhodospirillales bacterium]|nr:VPLPA-CTERM sorting domain-containing protein [Rhodospirillales bacterium]
MIKVYLLPAMVGVVLATVGSCAQAALVTVNFQFVVKPGTYTSFVGDSVPQVGTSLDGSYTFDDALPNACSGPGYGCYYGAVKSVSYGGIRFLSDGSLRNYIISYDNSTSSGNDAYFVEAHRQYADLLEGFFLAVVGGQTISSVAAASFPALGSEDYADAVYSLLGTDPATGNWAQKDIWGSVSSIQSVAVVPLPAALPLMSAALGALVVVRHLSARHRASGRKHF